MRPINNIKTHRTFTTADKDGIDLTKYTAAAANETIPVSDKTIKSRQDEFHRTIKKERLSGEIVGNLFWCTGLAFIIGSGIAMGPSGILMGAFFYIACGGIMGVGCIYHTTKDKAATAVSDFHDTLQNDFNQLQKDAHCRKQNQLVKEADNAVKNGVLLTDKTIALLITVNPDLMINASTKLAITVHQARQMAACTRFKEKDKKSVDEKTPLPPITFRSENLNPDSEYDQDLLMHKLQETCVNIAEVNKLKFKKIEITPPSWTKWSIGDFFARAAALPFYTIRDHHIQTNYQAPPLPAAPMPVLKPVNDFSERLVRYESDRQIKLDMPAMRGWR